MYNIEAIATDIRDVRLYKNYSQEYLANKLKISQNAYSKIEYGHTKVVTLETLRTIAEVLEIDLIEIENIREDAQVINYIPAVPELPEVICYATNNLERAS
jgi:transcriptional regulator with XRE-family HTH domain